MEFRLYGGEDDAPVEGMTTFKYLGLLLEQTENDWP